MPFLPVADASSIGIVLGLAFGRLGCTSAGCCFGKPTTLPWAITFTDPACLAPLHVPLHPTQIYESIGGFAIFGILYATRDRFKTPGMRFWTMLILYGAARAFFEIFRDDPRGFVGPFSESQVVSAVLIAYAVVSILRARSKAAPLRPVAGATGGAVSLSVVHHVLEKSQWIRKRSLPPVGSRVPRFPEDRREFPEQGELTAQAIPPFLPGVAGNDDPAPHKPRQLPADALDIDAGNSGDETRMQRVVREIEEDRKGRVERFRREQLLDHGGELLQIRGQRGGSSDEVNRRGRSRRSGTSQ